MPDNSLTHNEQFTLRYITDFLVGDLILGKPYKKNRSQTQKKHILKIKKIEMWYLDSEENLSFIYLFISLNRKLCSNFLRFTG